MREQYDTLKLANGITIRYSGFPLSTDVPDGGWAAMAKATRLPHLKLTLADMLLEFLLEHPEGATLLELKRELGAATAAIAVLVNALEQAGDLMPARDKREVKSRWELTSSMADSSVIARTEHQTVYRLSPQKWIEMVS